MARNAMVEAGGVAQAEKLLDERQEYDDGSTLVLRLWRVPSPVPPATHVFK